MEKLVRRKKLKEETLRRAQGDKGNAKKGDSTPAKNTGSE